MPITLDGTAGITNDATDLNYTGTLTGGTGVINIGSGQLYKDASGNVGIGTSSPGTKLHVSGTGGVVGLVKGTTSSQVLAETTSVIAEMQANEVLGQVLVGSRSNHPLLLRTNNTERARIDTSGNLLVGVTSSIGSGSNTLTGTQLSPNFFWLATNDSAYIQRPNNTNGNVLVFLRGSATVGSISVTASATTYATSSDYRLKHDIQPMTGALAKVAALKPVTYKWNADDSQSQGFIAHELQEVVPECVTGEKDAVDADGKPVYQGIDTSFLVATLTAAIQEQQAIIEQLKADVAALKGAQA
jgi:hypothetical protein